MFKENICRKTSGDKSSEKIFAEKFLKKKIEENICTKISAAEILAKKRQKNWSKKIWTQKFTMQSALGIMQFTLKNALLVKKT